MSNLTPIFPLELVVYPGEQLHLHIFEPRYKQLIQDCSKFRTPFGIPSVLNQKIKGLGTRVELLEITKLYEGGEMDIQTRGLDVFRIAELVKHVPDKLYSGASLELLENRGLGDKELMLQLIVQVKQMLKILNVEKKLSQPTASLMSYDLAHHVGFSLEQEYELLAILDEKLRQEYLKNHLSKMLPIVVELESLKQKTQLNGHFKALPGFEV
jgi:Lon protease-like protein